MSGDVWINGHHLGRRPYGYSSVAYDITAHLVPGVNVVAVRVDNSAQPNSRGAANVARSMELTAPTSFNGAVRLANMELRD